MSARLGTVSLVALVLAVGCAPAAKPPVAVADESGERGQHEPGHEHGEGGHHHGKHGFSKSFDDAEKWAAKFEGPERDAWQKPDTLMDAIEVAEGEAVADLGTGTGYLLPHLTKRVAESGSVLGIDVSESMIAYVNDRIETQGWTNVEARVVAPDDPALDGANLDRIVTVNVWHHVSNREAYAARVLAGLAPGGTFYVVDFTEDSPVGPPPEHRLTSGQVEAELQAAGFQTRVVEVDLPHQYVVAGTK